MNVGLSSLQSSLINYSARQHVFKPIVYLVAAIALAIISGLVICSAFFRPRGSSRGQHQYRRLPPATPLHQEYRGVLHGHSEGRSYYASPTVRDLESIPYEYIKSLASAIRSIGLDMDFSAHFKNADGSPGEAYDAGGPTRQFFNLLFQSLKTRFSSAGAKPIDFHPHTNKSGTLLVPQGKPTNDPKTSIFYDIGSVMTYVFFSSRSPLIGPVFHESIFAAMLSLDDQEIDTPFAQLSDATKFKICKALINTQQASGENFDDYGDILKFLDKGAQFQKEDIENANVKNFYAIHALNEDSRDFLGEEGDEFDINAVTFDWSAIENNKRRFFSKYWNYFLQQKTDSLGTIELTLFPIHTMAKAMKEASKERWSTIRSTDPLTVAASSPTADPQIEAAKRLQRKIQGVLDREVLVSKINLYVDSQEIMKQQTDWIKAWILDPQTTDTLIEGLLTFWTGSSYIDWDKVDDISICTGLGGLLPTASTCGRTLYISSRPYSEKNARGEPLLLHNHTKEGYYQVLNKIAGEYSSVYTHC